MLLFSVVAEKAEQKERTKVKFMKHFVFFLLTFSMMLSPLLGATEATAPFCTAFYAVKGDEVQYESSLVRCSPLENYACISVSVTYQIPVNYEITAVNVYLNDEPAQQLSQLSPGTYYGIFEIPQNGIETLKLVPIAKTSYAVDTITEELIDETIEWNDFETIEKAV